MIAIVDYGMGNLRSVQKALERVGYPAQLTTDPDWISRADGLVLPGVGAFQKAMENLENLGFIRPLRRFIESGKAFLGICLGLQMLFSESEEFGRQKGLGIFRGKVIRFPFGDGDRSANPSELKVPHMGWNDVKIHKASWALEGIEAGTHFYFVHSYFPVPEDSGLIATTTEYGIEFASSIGQGNLFACQFHPEKSQAAGLRILQNFGRRVYG
jgi:glutamine amidotransferase